MALDIAVSGGCVARLLPWLVADALPELRQLAYS